MTNYWKQNFNSIISNGITEDWPARSITLVYNNAWIVLWKAMRMEKNPKRAGAKWATILVWFRNLRSPILRNFVRLKKYPMIFLLKYPKSSRCRSPSSSTSWGKGLGKIVIVRWFRLIWATSMILSISSVNPMKIYTQTRRNLNLKTPILKHPWPCLPPLRLRSYSILMFHIIILK